MAQRIWMVLSDRGCPRSHTFILYTASGERRKYRFERNGSCLVEDEHVEQVLNAELPDVQGNPRRFFTTTPPATDLDDQERLRMQVEAQAAQLAEMRAMLERLAPQDAEEKLGIDNPLEALAGLADG